jgi:hypothetical protein
MKHQPLTLTGAQIDGADPAHAAWKVLLAHAENLKGKEYLARMRELPQHWRAVYTTCHLEGEVNNGGHHQFFWNSDGELNKETLDDLRLISASPFVLLFEEALDEYQRHDYSGDKKDSGNTWEAFTEGYEEKRMATLDTAFCKVPKTIAIYLSDYIRSHRNKYLENSERGAPPNGV